MPTSLCKTFVKHLAFIFEHLFKKKKIKSEVNNARCSSFTLNHNKNKKANHSRGLDWMYGGPMWAILSASRYSWRIIPFNESHAFYVRSYWSFREGRGSASPATEGELCNITFPNFYFSIYSIFYQLNTLVKFDKLPPPPPKKKILLSYLLDNQKKLNIWKLNSIFQFLFFNLKN